MESCVGPGTWRWNDEDATEADDDATPTTQH